jgi:hypothetical protein
MVVPDKHQLPPLGDVSFFGVLLGTNTKLTHMLGFFVLI